MERFSHLRRKEVINICDGRRLGFVGDLELKVPEGEVKALIVFGPCRFFGLFGRGEEFYIPWECIQRIGDDIILIDKPFSGGIPAWSGSGASVADKCPRGFHRGGICVCRRSGHGSSG